MTDHLSGGRADQDLGTVGGVHHSSGSVHRSTEVVAVAFVRFAAVQTHADGEPKPVRPGGVRERDLAHDGGRERSVGAVEAAANPSPPVEKTWPAWATIVDRRISSWRASAVRMWSGRCSQDAVDPSTSVNRNVTVPEGRRTTAASLTWDGDRGAPRWSLQRCCNGPWQGVAVV